MFTDLQPPPEEPITLAEAKTFLRVAHDDEDELIGSLIASARMQVEARAHVAMVARPIRLSLPVCATRIRIPVTPVRELIAVTHEGQAVDGAELSIRPHASWLHLPRRRDGFIELDIRAGFGTAADIPVPLLQAVLLLVADAHEHREREAGFERTSLRIDALIAPYRGPRL